MLAGLLGGNSCVLLPGPTHKQGLELETVLDAAAELRIVVVMNESEEARVGRPRSGRGEEKRVGADQGSSCQAWCSMQHVAQHVE